ncbi:hypothetical protein D3C76_1237910 [compost metagenome]
MAQSLGVVEDVELHTVMLHGSSIRRHKVQLNCHLICWTRWDADQRIDTSATEEAMMPFTRRTHVDRGVNTIVIEDDCSNQPLLKLTHGERSMLV